MDAKHPFEVLTEHPLSETSRLERRSLLAVSAVAIAMKWTGIFPTGVTAIGLSFPGEHGTLILVLGLTITYLLCVFALSALTDFANWRHRFSAAVLLMGVEGGTDGGRVQIEDDLSGRPMSLEAGERIQELYFYRYGAERVPFWKVVHRIAPSAVGKALLDFVLPVVLGVFAECYLLPPMWIVGIVTAAYLTGFAIAFSQSRVVHPPTSRAIKQAFMSWLYIWRRNIEARVS